MPGLGDPLVREMRRIAAAHAAFPGQPPSDPEELIESYESGTTATGPHRHASGITRREFLRRGAAVGVGVAGATALGWSRARPASSQEANVVVVGAGLGGLTCAYRLMRHGIASTLWESRDRVGGRCWSIRVFDNTQTAEHGGQYIDTRHRQIRNLARELHVPLVDTEAQSFPAGAGDYFWFDGAFHTREAIFADFPLVLDRLKKDYQQTLHAASALTRCRGSRSNVGGRAKSIANANRSKIAQRACSGHPSRARTSDPTTGACWNATAATTRRRAHRWRCHPGGHDRLPRQTWGVRLGGHRLPGDQRSSR